MKEEGVMMNSIRLVCFGSLKENLEKAIKHRVIGLKNNIHFDESGEQLYLIVKDDSEWKVYGRAKSGKETNTNPFEDGISYHVFEINELELCEPFGISSLLKECLGPYYGLKLQQPSKIEAESFIKEIQTNFEKKKIKTQN